MWSPLVPRLAAAHRVIALDLRGFRRSPAAAGRFSHAGDLLALLDALGVERAAVVGASVGEEAALEAGDVDAAVDATLRMWVDGHRREAPTDPAVRALVADMYGARVAPPGGAEGEEDEPDPPTVTRLGEIRAPALVVVGEHDAEDFPAIVDRLATSLPAANAPVTLAGAAHLPALERPEKVAGLLLAFLAEAGVSSAAGG